LDKFSAWLAAFDLVTVNCPCLP